VREVEVQTYFAKRLLKRLTGSKDKKEQEKFGRLLETYLMPEDFRRLTEDGEDTLTLVLDPETAAYPWEMAGFKTRYGTSFFGPARRLTRQFRSLVSAAPGVGPPLNQILRVLVIADPAAGDRRLPDARAEGVDVVKTLEEVKRIRGEDIQLSVVARIGARSPAADDAELRTSLEELRACRVTGGDVDTCDPVEILALILNEEFDVVHYCGHAIFDASPNRRGWVFDDDCILSAREIFKVRQVPRLVFANACYSAATDPDANRLQRDQVGLAQAFFARGIPNYIGTGWPVGDALARRFAHIFYSQALGVRHIGNTPRDDPKAPPATLGESLAAARQAILHRGSTWGAYQHYGSANAKLVALPNRH
jgi:hypothetical protein